VRQGMGKFLRRSLCLADALDRGPRRRQRAGITTENKILGKTSSQPREREPLKTKWDRELLLSRSIPLVSGADINKMRTLSPHFAA
jgi:hypothetical protein